jgi:hypothetical protein
VAGNFSELPTVTKLRGLASWYREFAEKAASPWIWEDRLRRARELDREADILADRHSARSVGAIDTAQPAEYVEQAEGLH